MIRVTIWDEGVHELGAVPYDFLPQSFLEKHAAELPIWERDAPAGAAAIKKIYPKGLLGTVADYLGKNEDMEVTLVTMMMPEFGLPDEVLDKTDVLIWWGHMAHELVPDELVKKIKSHVLRGMGFIPLHSAHMSKPFGEILGCSGTLRWRDDDFCRVWNVNPTHPIAQGIPVYFELEQEEMYGECFDIPKPDDIVFISWFRGGEVFRGGCTWTRGYGKIFYFHPGHETNPSYNNPYVLKIIENAVRWANPIIRRETLDCVTVTEPMKS